MYYFVCYINILLTPRSRLNSRFKKTTPCHSFMVLNRASDVPAADWLSQTLVKNNRNFSSVVIRFFSEVEIPIKHTSLYNKVIYPMDSTIQPQLTNWGQMDFFRVVRNSTLPPFLCLWLVGGLPPQFILYCSIYWP